MPRPRRGRLHVGVEGHVIAPDRSTGIELWRAKLEIEQGRRSEAARHSSAVF